MATYTFERLSSQDASFLVFESENTPMNVGGPIILEQGPLATSDDGVDVDRIRAYVAARLDSIPRYRQLLSYSPISGHPVWIDDRHFNLNYHVRHTSLPRPGSETQLKDLSARIMAQSLDRRRPLWELWVVEGLRDGRFAMIAKTHHCMVDGVTGVDLVSTLLQPIPETSIDKPARWIPRPEPSWVDMMEGEVTHLIRQGQTLRRGLGDALQRPQDAMARLEGSFGSAWQMFRDGLLATPETPLNRPTGCHRRFDWLELPLDELKEVKNRLGGTVNDVVLASVAGGVGHFLRRHGVTIDALDFRAVVPVNIRSPAERTLGNRVSAWITSLPIAEPDPRRRLAKVRQATARLKASKQESGAAMLAELGEWANILLRFGVQLAKRMHPYNLIVTNVAGPQFPLYLLGSRMLSGFPVVPLFENQGLGVALFSYDGRIFWGFNADWDTVPDLPALVAAVHASFREIQAVARGDAPLIEPAASKSRPPRAAGLNGAAVRRRRESKIRRAGPRRSHAAGGDDPIATKR